MTLSAYPHQYLASLQNERQLSPNTVGSYERDLIELERFAQEAKTDITQIGAFQIRKFAAQLHAHGLNPRSISRKLSAWRGFYQWLSEHIDLPNNPVADIKPPKKSKPLPKALSVDDAVALVSQIDPFKKGDEPIQLCNKAMFELLYSSGLRVSELVNLDVRYAQEPGYQSLGWLDTDNQEVIVTGKGNKMRSVPVGTPAMTAIEQWLAVRATYHQHDGEARHRHALFLTERGTRMSPRVAQLRIKAHGKALGLPTDVHPHVLRHSFASHILQSSGDLRAVQELLGHASITSTQVYTSLDFQHLAQVYDAAHPRAKKVTSK